MPAYHDVPQDEPVLSASSLDDDNASDSTLADEKARNADGFQKNVKRANRLRAGLFLGSVTTNIVLLVGIAALFVRYQKRDPWVGVPKLWTPADHIKDHIYVRFPDVLDTSPYSGFPTPELDHAWNELYKWGISEIPESDAAKLDSPTMPFMSQPDKYVVEMDVFHQLHCLNLLRKSLYPEYYPKDKGPPFVGVAPLSHLEHCVNNIRESLMCSADTTPNRWIWLSDLRVSDPHFDNVHTCRNWDAIVEFAKETSAKRVFDRWNFAGSDLQYPADPFKDYDVIQRFKHVDLFEFHHYDYSHLDKMRPHPDQHSDDKE